ncbi:MAG TPA: class F sortase [Candidatus Paceibacterota bacterium]|nr:class F sortase [Candidatus Paceibacterota bacterium]
MNLSKFLLKRKIAIIAVSICCVFSLVFIYHSIFKNFKNDSLLLNSNIIPILNNEKASISLPVRLKIPKLNIDSVIEYVGVSPDGAMDVPKGPADTAWFYLGPRPGEPGSSVIAGHSGWKNGIPAVFDDLYKLQKGDKIYVEDEKGDTITFIARDFKTYSPNEDDSDVFGSNDGKAHLNLITCTGFWNKILKSHSDRLVVFADKEI